MWDVTKAVEYLNKHAHKKSLGRCAQYTRQAIEAGGIRLTHHTSAKDYGNSLVNAGFKEVSENVVAFKPGDVVIIQPIPKHPHGHMAMFNGKFWVSDFLQQHGFYPGQSYRKLHPTYTVYRHRSIDGAPSTQIHSSFSDFNELYLSLRA